MCRWGSSVLKTLLCLQQHSKDCDLESELDWLIEKPCSPHRDRLGGRSPWCVQAELCTNGWHDTCVAVIGFLDVRCAKWSYRL